MIPTGSEAAMKLLMDPQSSCISVSSCGCDPQIELDACRNLIHSLQASVKAGS